MVTVNKKNKRWFKVQDFYCIFRNLAKPILDTVGPTCDCVVDGTMNK